MGGKTYSPAAAKMLIRVCDVLVLITADCCLRFRFFRSLSLEGLNSKATLGPFNENTVSLGDRGMTRLYSDNVARVLWILAFWQRRICESDRPLAEVTKRQAQSLGPLKNDRDPTLSQLKENREVKQMD